MRATEFLAEAATAVVYHYAGIGAAAKILTSGVFQLSSVTATRVKKCMPLRDIRIF